MKVLLDTSTLLAAIVSSHPGHARAKAWLDLVESKKISAVVCMHSLAEVYANLTRVPFTVPPAMAVQLIDLNIRNKFEDPRAACRVQAMVGPCAKLLPHSLNAVTVQNAVGADERETFDLRLSDYQAIKRVTVMGWQGTHDFQMVQRDAEHSNAVCVQLCRK